MTGADAAPTRVPLHRKDLADRERARAIISSLRLHLENWSPAFIDLVGPDDEDFLYVLFDPSTKQSRTLQLIQLALSEVADDWRAHFDPPGPVSKAVQ